MEGLGILKTYSKVFSSLSLAYSLALFVHIEIL
jgi:hypothetical protein